MIVAAGVYVGPQCVLRGDFGRIEIGQGANVQETCVVHTFPNLGVIVEPLRPHRPRRRPARLPHRPQRHGRHERRRHGRGRGRRGLDRRRHGLRARPARKIPPRSLAVGSPARVIRELSDAEIDWKTRGTAVYQRLALEARAKLAPAEPLAAPEPGRRRVRAPDYDPLIVERLKLGD